MVRRHDEPVSVRVGGAADGARADGARADGAWADGAWADSDDGPRDFVWRGRRYTVCAVLASWQERRAWWREVGDLRVGGQPAGPAGSGLPSPQRRVWRVEARPPSGTAGVFDLGLDDDRWLLLRAHD
ncbi:MAG TPA: DUF6504 family protein [Ornithinibacter sp.]|nr:DUF6504 family protein [Ornithinibacter sp.]